MTVDEFERLAETAPTAIPPITAAVLAKDKAFYIFTSGTTGMPKASVMTHYRWLRALAGFGGLGMRLNSNDTLYCCLPLYHNNALTVAVGSVLNAGATLALGKSFSASKFWDEVIRYDATFVYIGEICGYLLNQPPKHRPQAQGAGDHRQRPAPAIWDEFTERFGIERVCEFYGASEGNTAFVNVFNVTRARGSARRRWRSWSTTRRPVSRCATRRPRAQGQDRRAGSAAVQGQQLPAVRRLHRQGGQRKKWCATLQGRRRLVQHRRPDALAGLRHAAFTDRFGDTFRWKGENVATTEVEAAVSTDPQVEEATVFGVEGRRGRPRGHGGHPAQGGRGVRRQGVGQGGLRASARLCRAVVRPRRGGAGAHLDVQEPEGRPAQGGLRPR